MRLQFNFWLDLNKPTESDLAETVADLKERRAYSQVIRDGLAIIPALLVGNPDPLLERFPWVVDMVLSRYGQNVTPTPEPAKVGGNDDSGVNDIKREIQQLRQELKGQSNYLPPSPMVGSPVAMSGNLKPMGTGNLLVGGSGELPPPALDDFDFDLSTLEIKKDESAGTQSSENLRRTLMSMYNGEGVWASKPKEQKAGARL